MKTIWAAIINAGRSLFGFFVRYFWALAVVYIGIVVTIYPYTLVNPPLGTYPIWQGIGPAIILAGFLKIYEFLQYAWHGKDKKKEAERQIEELTTLLNQQVEDNKKLQSDFATLTENMTAMRSEIAELKTMLAAHTPLVDQSTQNGKAEHEVQQLKK